MGTEETVLVRDAHGRLTLKKVKVPDLDDSAVNPEKRMVMSYSNAGFEVLKPQKCITATCLFFGFDRPVVQVAWELQESMGDLISSTGSGFRNPNLSMQQLKLSCDNFRCGCWKYGAKFKNPSTGHLCTMSTDWIRESFGDVKLADLLDKGLNHIPLTKIDPKLCCRSLVWLVWNVIEEQARSKGVIFEDVRGFVNRWCVNTWLQSNSQCSDGDGFVLEDHADNIREIRKKVLITGMDKAKNQGFFACRQYSILQTLQHLNDAPGYMEISASDATACLGNIRSKLVDIGLDNMSCSGRLPSMYPLFKPKKKNYRYITSMAECAYSEVGTLIAEVGLICLEVLKGFAGMKNRYLKTFFGINVQCFPILMDTREALLNLPLHGPVTADFTADVAKAYDSLVIDPAAPDSVQSGLRYCFETAETHSIEQDRKQLRFCVSFKGESLNNVWRYDRRKSGGKKLKASEMLQLQDTVLQNVVLQVGGHYFKQIQGIPQGIACGPVWANLFFLSCELKFILMTVSTVEGRLLLGNRLQFFYRFLDDLRILNDDKAMDIVSSIYPSSLTIESTVTPGPEGSCIKSSSQFLDYSSVLLKNGCLLMNSLFKVSSLPFCPIQLVLAASNRPRSGSMGMLSGAVHRIAYHCNYSDGLKHDLAETVAQFVRNGFPFRKCLKQVENVMMEKNFPGARLDLNAAWQDIKVSLRDEVFKRLNRVKVCRMLDNLD